MNLTDILFGMAILGGGGSSNAVKPIVDADLTYLEEFDRMYYFDAVEGQLVEGTFYMVTLGGSVYAAKAKRFVDEEEPGFFALYLGNAAIEDYGVDTGEPFFYVEQTYEGESERILSTTNGVSHVTITKTETSDSGLKTVTFDGSIDGKETFAGELMGLSGVFVKVLDTAIPPDEMKDIIITCHTDKGVVSNSIMPDVESFAEVGGFGYIQKSIGGLPVVFAFCEDIPIDDVGTVTAGTYVLYDENYAGLCIGYVSALTYGNSGGGSDDSVGEYKQMTFIIPAGSETTCVSETVPDMREGAFGFVVIKRGASDGSFNYYYEESLINGFVDEHEDGYLCFRAVHHNSTEVFQFGLITKEIVDMMEEPIPAGFYLLMSAEPFEYGAEVTIFWKNPPTP